MRSEGPAPAPTGTYRDPSTIVLVVVPAGVDGATLGEAGRGKTAKKGCFLDNTNGLGRQ